MRAACWIHADAAAAAADEDRDKVENVRVPCDQGDVGEDEVVADSLLRSCADLLTVAVMAALTRSRTDDRHADQRTRADPGPGCVLLLTRLLTLPS